MAIFFGLQSLQAYSIFGWFADIYRDAGFSSGTAGLLLGRDHRGQHPDLVRRARPRGPAHSTCPGWSCFYFGCYVVGYTGLIVAPVAGAVVWAVLVGLGTATFPLILTLIGLRARTAAGTAALSGFTQSVGYLIAALGPFVVGAAPRRQRWLDGALLLALTRLSVPLLMAGLAVSRTAYLEDQLQG